MGSVQEDCAACRMQLCTLLSENGRGGYRQGRLLERGERLEAGEGACLRFWIVVRGTAGICTAFADGRRQIVGLVAEGDTVCGQMAAPGLPSWLEALSECWICDLDLSPSARELERDVEFLTSLFGLIHDQVERSARHITTLGRLDSMERVLLFLAERARRAGADGNGCPEVSLPMSREDIADYLGLNAETVSRTLSRIRKAGLVRFQSPTRYCIPDMTALERRLPIDLAQSAVRPGRLNGFSHRLATAEERH